MKTLFRNWLGLHAGVAIAISTLAAQGVVQVKTLGGGPNQTSPARSGATDGDTLLNAKFNGPFAVATDHSGNVYVADRNNGKIRKISKPGSADSVTSTFLSRLASPVGVAVDRSNNVYVVTQRDGKLRKFSSNGSLLLTIGGLVAPTALALDASDNAYVTELRGTVQKIAPDGSFTFITSGFIRPRGIAVMKNGLLAVSESGTHAIHAVDPTTGASTVLAGKNGAGFNDGPGDVARFNSPFGVAVAPNGSVVVADRLNHRVRVVDTNGTVSTLYGLPRAQWHRPFAGWADGPGGFDGTAAAREPIGVFVSSNGNVYVTELTWQLVRQATETGLTTSNNSVVVTNGTNVTVVFGAPTFSPVSGYFPFGVTITVTSSAPVYYTTDGSEPTTNSRQVQLIGDVGSFRFSDSSRDLTSLRLKAITPQGSSITVGGTASAVNEFGIPRDCVAGSGSTIVVPVVANLRANDRIQSFQYRVEVTPLNGGPPVLPYLRASKISTNDFVQLVTAAAANKEAHITVSPPYAIGATRGLIIAAGGTNANVDFQKFAATAMLVIPIDPSAFEGHTYRVEVVQASATRDGYQDSVPVTTGPARTITIASTPWLVADPAPGTGYNAGEFGDGELANNDVNSVLFASVGLRLPFEFTDVFNAMDAFPPEPSAAGGDGRLEYADWQVVLERSLRLDPANWTRRWLDGGVIQSDPVGLAADRKSVRATAKVAEASAPGDVWTRGATLIAGNLYNQGNGICQVPVSIKVAPGISVGGLCFRVLVEALDGSASVSDVSFAPLLGQSVYQTFPGGAPNDVVCSWTMVPSPAFSLTGSNVLGFVRFTIPANATAGQHYRVAFIRPSGAADLQTAVSFDSIPGSAWVLWNPGQPAETTADEWRANFFGTTNNPAAYQFADPDHDGVPNWREYLDGTSPTDAGSFLHLEENVVDNTVQLSWLSAPGKLYVIERGGSADGPWAILVSGVAGDGYAKQVVDYAPSAAAPIYRVRVQP